ncbi:MAG: RimJ/RimL family protein N-acetyltransferase [Shewanella sp.]|jgi:RimJ/RimL family protein N-acetyltransferase
MLELYTDRLRLRTVIASDWDNFLYTHSNVELNQYVRKPQSETVIREKFEHVLIPNDFNADEWLLTVIEDIHSHDFVGFVGLHNSNAEMSQIEVGYMMHDSCHGRGYASESLSAIIDWACLSYSPHKFVAYCVEANVGSAKVLEKCGFKREGLLRDNCKVGEQWFDDYIFGLLVAERV